MRYKILKETLERILKEYELDKEREFEKYIADFIDFQGYLTVC